MTAAPRRTGGRLDDAEFRRLIDGIKATVNLSDVIGRKLPLKRAGTEWKACCPFHNERTPSFTVNDALAFWHCFGCGVHGDVLRWLTDAEGLTFREAYHRLASDDLPKVSLEQRLAERVKLKEADLEAEHQWRCWFADAEGVKPGDPVDLYLRARGITMPAPPTIRFGMVPSWRNKDTGEWGRLRPAMLCTTQDRDGKLVGGQRVFLDGERPDKAACKLSYGTIKTAACRLGPAAETILTTEGPEDALSLAQELPGRSVWISFGTANLPFMMFPPIVRRVIAAGQNNKAGRLAVDNAALSLVEQGYEVERMFPDPRYDDYNDQLRGREKD